jgi:hypothetical protein
VLHRFVIRLGVDDAGDLRRRKGRTARLAECGECKNENCRAENCQPEKPLPELHHSR